MDEFEFQKSSRIFVVDDQATNLKLVDRLLRGQGYDNLVLIEDPCQVLDHYQSARPDLILLDLNMPRMDGYQVMEQLRSLNDPLLPPIVVLTAQQGRDYLIRAFTAGARDYLTKPFNAQELMMRVRNLLQAHLAHRLIHDQRSMLEEIVRARTDELKQTQLQVVRRLGRAAEFRDNETGQHIVRMSLISELLAKCLGWSEVACELILNASPMHDIGKIGIPDAILLKPGRLEPEEFDVIKTHCEIGARLLDGDDSELLEMARTIALYHHEKWDGSGYPFGLAGTDIPQAARIIAVADVFDALTSSRPYKKGWSAEDAYRLIVEGAGRHFDPEVVDTFIENFEAILAIREANLDSQML